MKKCDKCYIEVEEKNYTIFRGILLTIVVQIFLMIPILGIIFLKIMVEEEGNKHFWKGAWYNITTKQIKVKEAKHGRSRK